MEKVKLVIRRDVFRADPLVQKQVINNPKIEIIKKHVPVAYIVSDDAKLAGVKFKNVETEEVVDISADGLFPYIGADPVSHYLKEFDVLEDGGYLLCDARMHTKVPGIFGAGDLIDKTLRQIITAAGDGSIAAQEAFYYVQAIKSKES